QKPSLLRPSYLIIGRLAGLFRISSVIALHVSRVILSIILLFVLYRFIFKFFRDPNKRILAFLIVVVSNGFGTINWVPEAITFLALGEPPHFILSQIFILLGFYFFMEYLEKRDYKFIFVFSLIFFLLSLEHPFDIAVISPTIFFTSLWMGSSVFEAIFLALIVSFGLVYQVFEVFSNSVFKFWANQNVLMSPSLHDVVLGYGFLIPLSFVGVEKFFKKLTYERKLLLVWFFWG